MPRDAEFLPQLIRALDLQPLAGEGGLFHEMYRSVESIPAGALPERYSQEEKPFGTAILYLLTEAPDSFSTLHRLLTDEIWHFYLGDPLELTLLLPGGQAEHITLGQDVLNGQRVQFTVPRGTWMGARLAAGGQFALLGTTMAPGFTPCDFQLGGRDQLLAEYPAEREQILALTRA